MAAKNKSTVNFGEAAQVFRDAGVSGQFLIPVAPPGASIGPNASLTENVLGKAPGRYHPGKGQWGGLSGKVLVTGVTRSEFEEFSAWPTGNVGLLGRGFPAIDSDANSPAARQVVARAVHDTFRNLPAVRIRGKNDRLLYAFAARDWQNDPVRTRHLTYTLPDDAQPHKVDIIGNGGQYLIAGTHPSGDPYGWDRENDLGERDVVDALKRDGIDNADIGQFLEALEYEIKQAGGQITRSSGGSADGGERSVAKLPRTMELADILAGLDRLPNTSDNFLHRDDFVAVLSAIRAAAGKDGLDAEFVDKVREWATAGGDDWCSDQYFDKIWRSLDRVRSEGDTLERFFRRNKIFHTAGNAFDRAGPPVQGTIKKAKDQAVRDRAGVLDHFYSQFIVGDVNLKTDIAKVEMRSTWDPSTSWPAIDWYNCESTRSNVDFVADVHREFGTKKEGFWTFMRALYAKRPECFYQGETLSPNHEYGEIVEDFDNDSGRTRRLLNLRHISATIRHGKEPDLNPGQSAADVRRILEFVDRLFGSMSQFELDTVAWMLQTDKRPGSMLLLIGESGVGKSLYTQMLVRLFNGSRPDQSGVIDGAKVVNESAARFAFAKVEGCRIISIRELPKGGKRNAAIMAQATSTIKQMVDAGPEGDFISIEEKGKNTVLVRNHARVIASSNYADSMEIEAGDRRIFMVEAKIKGDNKPPESYYAELAEVVNSPERLAAFYRYLLTRDVRKYSPNAAPPVSSAKAEAVVTKISQPVERHMRAAVALFEFNNRRAFDSDELAEVMTELSEIEANNLGNGDQKTDYVEFMYSKDPATRLKYAQSMRNIHKYTLALEQTRTTKSRDRRIFCTLGQTEFADKLVRMHREDRLAVVEEEYNYGCPNPHPWAQFRRVL